MKKLLYIIYFLLRFQGSFATPTKDQIDAFIQENRNFSLSLYDQLDQNQNIIFSPYSLFSCLSMAYVGAREETANEIEKVLSLTASQQKSASLSFALQKLLASKKEEVQLTIANGLWVAKDSFILSDYRHKLQEDFSAQVDALDFQKNEEAVQIINEWTSNTTQGLIPKLLESEDVNPFTRIILTNALYFKGNWAHPFDPQKTLPTKFYPTPETHYMVPMMEQSTTLAYFENDLVQMIALPFQEVHPKNSQFACLLLLPQEEISFAEIKEELTSQALRAWIAGLKPTSMQIKIPRFALSGHYDLNEPLKQMGMQLAFTEKANFSGIDGMRDLFIHKIIHAAYFSLNEIGVTASAATAASIGVTSAPPKKSKPFIANKPFLFFIIDMDSALPIFMGKLIEPKNC